MLEREIRQATAAMDQAEEQAVVMVSAEEQAADAEIVKEVAAEDIEAAVKVAAVEAEAADGAAGTEATKEAAIRAELTTEVTVVVRAMIQEAQLHGDVMTVAEAVWRHEQLKQEEELCGGMNSCTFGDAAFPQGKQHPQRRRSRKKKKKK